MDLETKLKERRALDAIDGDGEQEQRRNQVTSTREGEVDERSRATWAEEITWKWMQFLCTQKQASWRPYCRRHLSSAEPPAEPPPNLLPNLLSSPVDLLSAEPPVLPTIFSNGACSGPREADK